MLSSLRCNFFKSSLIFLFSSLHWNLFRFQVYITIFVTLKCIIFKFALNFVGFQVYTELFKFQVYTKNFSCFQIYTKNLFLAVDNCVQLENVSPVKNKNYVQYCQMEEVSDGVTRKIDAKGCGRESFCFEMLNTLNNQGQQVFFSRIFQKIFMAKKFYFSLAFVACGQNHLKNAV